MGDSKKMVKATENDSLEKENVNILETVKRKLVEEIRLLEIRKSNLETGDIRKQVDDESSRKFSELERIREFNQRKKELADLSDKYVSKERALESRENALNIREQELEKREQEVKDFNEQMRKLQQERCDVHDLKREMKEQEEIFKTKKAEIEGFEKDFKNKMSVLECREISVKEKEKWWNDNIGKLQEDWKKFNREKAEFNAIVKRSEEEESKEVSKNVG